jgi:hypothetical protein
MSKVESAATEKTPMLLQMLFIEHETSLGKDQAVAAHLDTMDWLLGRGSGERLRAASRTTWSRLKGKHSTIARNDASTAWSAITSVQQRTFFTSEHAVE